jgi:hypothetical protein
VGSRNSAEITEQRAGLAELVVVVFMLLAIARRLESKGAKATTERQLLGIMFLSHMPQDCSSRLHLLVTETALIPNVIVLEIPRVGKWTGVEDAVLSLLRYQHWNFRHFLLLRLVELREKMIVGFVVVHALHALTGNAANVAENRRRFEFVVAVSRFDVFTEQLLSFKSVHTETAAKRHDLRIMFLADMPQHRLSRLQLLVAEIALIPNVFVRH